MSLLGVAWLSAVSRNASRTSNGPHVGCASSSRATSPLVSGAESDVPLART